jgi:hypothetical protein
MTKDDAPIYEQLQQDWLELLRNSSAEQEDISDWSFVERRLGSASPTLLFAQLEDVRSYWKELLDPSRLEPYVDRFISPAWTVKDLVAHVASWSCELRQQVETVAKGETITRGIPYALSVIGPNEWNEVEVEKRRPVKIGRILEEFEKETILMQDLVLDLPEQKLHDEKAFGLAPSGDPSALWKGTIAQVVLLKCGHDRYHMEHIRRLQEVIEQIA